MKRFGDTASYPQSPKYARKCEENNNKSPTKTCENKFKAKPKPDNVNKCTCGNGLSARCCPTTLAELAAKVAAAHVPYQLVEERYERIPEPVVKKLISWSFPRFEDDIRRYSALACEDDGLNSNLKPNREIRHSSPSNNQTEPRGTANVLSNTTGDLSGQDVTFKQGVALAKNGAVKNIVQIGFHISGAVHEKSKEANVYSSYPQKTVNGRAVYNVAATFDRCKVASSTCECQFGDGIFFCRHLVALLIFRIRNPSRVIIRAPISDTLQQLSRDQLQKLTQYLLSRHSCVLPTAQEIADRFADPNSAINVVNGAPDPTAGAGFLDEDRWLLDDKHVTKHVGSLLQQSSKQSCATQLFSMLGKVKEMMKVRDCNGTRLLSLITSELISQTCSMTSQQSEVGSKLWDQIGLLWICIVLNPSIEQCEKENVIEQLNNWVSESDSLIEQPFSAVSPIRITGRNVLLRAIEAKKLAWSDSHLKLILRRDRRKPTGIMMSQENNGSKRTGGFANFNSKGQPLWHEHPSISCARVEALRAHGFVKETIRLARAVARTIKGNAIENFNLFRDSQSNQQVSSPVKRNNAGSNLIGHPLNPIHILFETLNCSGKQKSAEFNSAALKKEAFEICILGLAEQKCMPQNASAQEEVVASEKMLISHLESVKLDENLISVLRDVTALLIEGGHASGFGKRVHRESVPVHLLGKYLFKSLLPHDRKLAFRVGLRAMRMPVLGETEADSPELSNQPPPENVMESPEANRNDDPTVDRTGEVPQNFYQPTPYPNTWSVMPDLENRQCELASELLQTAKGDVMLLRSIVESIQRHVRSGSHVFQLSHDAFKCATVQSATSHSDSTMLNVAMQLAMQVLQMTIQGGSWRRNEMVGWLVTCATEIGLYALLSIIKTWYTLFTPIEACQMVARCVISPNTAMRLNLSPRQREELYHDVCQMSVQSVVKDPQHCSLCSLTLCETFPSSFDAVYNVIIDASAKRRIDSAQLYTIARYLDQRGFHARAFKVGYAATKRLRVPFNHDGHPGASDLLWTTQLAQSLGMKELEDMVEVIVSKVRCASVLSDVIRTCTSSISGRLPNCTGPYPNRSLRADRAPLRPLLEASVSAYVNTIHSKLSHISPRHYMEFISFLTKAQEIFLMAPDGRTQFARLLTNLKTIYKGKKKLLNLVTVSFG